MTSQMDLKRAEMLQGEGCWSWSAGGELWIDSRQVKAGVGYGAGDTIGILVDVPAEPPAVQGHAPLAGTTARSHIHVHMCTTWLPCAAGSPMTQC